MTVLVTAGHDAWLTAVDIDRPEIRYRCIFGAGVPTGKKNGVPVGRDLGLGWGDNLLEIFGSDGGAPFGHGDLLCGGSY